MKKTTQQAGNVAALERMEKAAGIDSSLGLSTDQRVIRLLEAIMIHVGQVEEAHNTLAHTVRLKPKEEPPKSSLILPGR